jgi:hypothetical protein
MALCESMVLLLQTCLDRHGSSLPVLLCAACLSQVVVVLSGSMEPGFKRGDILFLNMGTQPARTGQSMNWLPNQLQANHASFP